MGELGMNLDFKIIIEGYIMMFKVVLVTLEVDIDQGILMDDGLEYYKY